MFKSVQRIARAVFSDQIRLRRSGKGFQLALTPPDAVEFTASQLRRQELQRQQESALHAMRSELASVLATCPEPAHRMPHLLKLHEAIEVDGLLVLKAMPLPALTRALGEFEQAVTNWSPVGLATLRSKMAVAVAERRKAGEADNLPAAKAPTVAVSHSDVPRTGAIPEVTEVDLPLDAAQADLAAVYGQAGVPFDGLPLKAEA